MAHRDPAKHAAYMREWRAAHPEHAEYQRVYHVMYAQIAGNAEKGRERARQWYRDNKARALGRRRLTYQSDPEKNYARTKQWQAVNRERHRLFQRAYQSRRRARLLCVTVGDVDYGRILERAGGVCQLCRQPLGDKWHFDHIVPVARGGEHTEANLQATHPRCNQRKNARVDWQELFA